MKDNIYAFGHKNPDTDSVCSAITLAYLKNSRKMHVTPYILGEINNETKYVLNYFKVNKPLYLNDVKLQISDLNYKKDCFLIDNNTLNDLYLFMQKENITGVPICRSNKEYLGMITIKDLLKVIIDSKYDSLHTSYDNLLSIINGKEILRFANEIKGKIILSAYRSKDFIENIHLTHDSILVIGNRYNTIIEAIMAKIKLIIIVGTNTISEEVIELAKKNKVSIITSNEELLYVSRILILSNYIKSIVIKDNANPIDEKMYVNDFLTYANKCHFTNYPVVDKKKRVLGLLRIEDVNTPNKKKVIMLDHNEYFQSVDGIEEADIIEIIDHHKIGNINSSSPINFRNMAVGSTNTIIYEMYKENKVKPPKNIAGLMLSGIISDTLMLHSPTTTNYDIQAVEELSKIAKIDPVKYSKGMFSAAASIKGKTIEELIYNDFKSFNINNRKIGIGQMPVINYEKILKDKNKYLDVIEKVSKEHDYDIFAFCITDIINNNTYLLYNKNSENVFRSVFGNNSEMYEGFKLDGIVSRKKQLIPKLMDELK